jgi:hypothetical protein
MRALIVTSLLLTGCALLEPQATDVDAVVADSLKAARGPHAEQKAALARAQAAFEKSPGDANRLRLATLLALLPPALRDDARAGELLEPLARVASPFGRFAALLSAQVGERQRLARELERIAREHDKADKERDKREEALRQQLEAVQSIERGIIDRQEKLRRQTPSVGPRR